MFVTYVLCDPLRDNKPFYVGWSEIKGSNFTRLKVHAEEAKKQYRGCNLHKARIIKKIFEAGNQVTTCVIPVPSKEEAVQLEIVLIKIYGRADKKLGPLTNLTDGGEGFRGWTLEQREHQSKMVSGSYEEKYGIQKAIELKSKVGIFFKGRKQSKEHIAARSKSMLGKNVGNTSIGSHSRERQLGKTYEELYGVEKTKQLIEKRNKTMAGRKWFNDGVRDRKLTQEEACKLRLIPGRVRRKIEIN